MARTEWPTKLEGNMFTVAKCDPKATPTDVKVAVWSSLFNDGGSVTVEAYLPDKKRVTVASIAVGENRSVVAERNHLQPLVDEFMENPKTNWRRLVNDARKRVIAYHERNAKESSKKLEKMRAGDFANA